MRLLDRLRARSAPADPLAASPVPSTAPPPVKVKVRTVGRTRILLAALLCLANAALSGVLLLQHHGEDRALAAVSQVCGEADRSGCEVVAHSRYSAVRGIPLAAIGLFFYLTLAALLLLASLAGVETRDAAASLALVALILAMAVDVVLLGVQMVAVRAFCRLCVLTYAVNALALVALMTARRDGTVVGQAVRRPDGRLVLAGWVMAAGALAAAVLAAEVGLSYRQRSRAAAALGAAPATLPLGLSASPATPGSEAQRFKEEARAASEQARRLQEILDDPGKLEQYFAEKASREYEQAPKHALNLQDVPFKGPPQAPIKVVEYSDFLCPFCRNIAGAFSSYLPGSGGRVAVYFKNYPLDKECNPHLESSIHAGACLVARGGLCALEQGRFWPYHDRVFALTLKDPQTAELAKMITEAGLDGEAWQGCLESATTRQRLEAEIQEAYAAGVRATPTLFINGKRLPRVNDFVQMVDKESARLGLPPVPKSP